MGRGARGDQGRCKGSNAPILTAPKTTQPTTNMPASKSASDIHVEAAEAIDTLRSRLKAIAREHSDRIHRLQELQKRILAARHGAQGLPGLDGITLEPDLQKLLANPVHGL